jgi:hypothetical protein
MKATNSREMESPGSLPRRVRRMACKHKEAEDMGSFGPFAEWCPNCGALRMMCAGRWLKWKHPTQPEQMASAIEEVLAHRREDKDGNYVMWIGEGAFLKCDAALNPPNK